MIIGQNLTEFFNRQAVGLPDVLQFLLSIADKFPNMDTIASTGGQVLGFKFATIVVNCLTSSKSETRSAATSLLESILSNGVVGVDTMRKACERLKPALQRTVAPLVAKFSKSASSSPPRKTPIDQPTAEDTVTESRPVASSPRNARPSQKATSDRKRTITTDETPVDSSLSGNPLSSRSGASRPSTKSIIWPEYPEEPQGASIFNSLRKAWTQIVSSHSISVLFPSSGIKKQDEGSQGCDLLVKALSDDRESGTSLFREQLDLILKWVAFVLCSRETTVGLQSILGLMKDMFAYLLERHHEFTDSQSLELVPYIFEKASNAKVRSILVADGILRFVQDLTVCL